MINHAVSAILNSNLVVFPTETVYGLGGDATSELAVSKIFKVKGRPSFNPLIVHVSSIKHAMEIAEFNHLALKAAKAFCPGPLTLILPIKHGHNIAPSVLSNLSTVAIRIPSHKIARALINLSGRPIAAPSANRSGYISATRYEHVKEFENFDIVVLDDDSGQISCGLESTILDLSGDEPIVLRYGFITPEAISSVLECSVSFKRGDIIIAPGMLSKHYSPNTKLRTNAISLANNEIWLGFGDIEFPNSSYGLNLSKSGDIIEAANNLYSMLRTLDCYAESNLINSIAVAPIPNSGIGLAINDRLSRASYNITEI